MERTDIKMTAKVPLSAQKATEALHRLCPISTTIVFISALILFLFIPAKYQVKRYATGRLQHRRLSWTSAGVCLTFLVDATLYLAHIQAESGFWPTHHATFYTASSILVWICLSVYIFEIRSPFWLVYISTWLTAALFDTALFALEVSSSSLRDGWALGTLLVQAGRIMLLYFSVAYASRSCYSVDLGDAASDEEIQGLLGDPETRSAGEGDTSSSTTYGSLEDDYARILSDNENDDEDDIEIKKLLKQRLRNQGGWLGYLKGFAIFLPYIIPYKNKHAQGWLLVMTLCVVVQRVLTVMIPRQLGTITELLGNTQSINSVPWKEIIIWGILQFPVAAATDMFQSHANTRVSQHAYTQLKAAAFGHVMGLSMDYHSDKSSGKLSKAIEQGADMTSILDNMFTAGPMFIDLAIAAIYLTSYFDYYMGLIVVFTTIAHIYISVKGTLITASMERVSSDKDRVENEVLYDSTSNWQTVAYHNRRKFEQDRYAHAVGANVMAKRRYYDWSDYVYLMQNFALDAGLIVAASVAASRVVAGTEPLSSFVFLVVYWNSIREPMAMIAWTFHQTAAHLINAEWLFQLLQTKSSIEDKEGAEDIQITNGRVEFTDVAFNYNPERPILEHMSFVAEGGQTIALVGETGGGKSTVLKLLYRFYDVKAGSITIDGQDIRDITLDSLRDCLGTVPQDPSVFDQTIMENIMYARPFVTEEEVYEACKAASIHTQILKFPNGYNTRIGERGVRLSGGELQRLAIARVILRKPKIVVLDEATSAVDSDTEASVQQALRSLSSGRTVFVVAHRLSTVVGADLILVIDQGRVVERGTHHELLRAQGKYSRLWSMQTTAHSNSEARETL